MPQWVTVYDVRNESAPVGNEIRGGAAGALIGALLLAVVWQRRDRAPKLFVLLFLLGWVGWSAANGVAIARAHRAAQAALARGAVTWTEGTVQNLVPPPPDGGFETFTVGERTFRIADGDTRKAGLTRSSVRGGPLRAGAHVKIASSDGSILRIDERRGE